MQKDLKNLENMQLPNMKKTEYFGSGDGVMDIVNIQCGKGTALKLVAEDIGIDVGQTMGIWR